MSSIEIPVLGPCQAKRQLSVRLFRNSSKEKTKNRYRTYVPVPDLQVTKSHGSGKQVEVTPRLFCRSHFGLLDYLSCYISTAINFKRLKKGKF
jgi:hypothetical protein